MQTCSCGDWAEEGRDRCARCSALETFGLDSTATADQIKAAHRTLVKVWHPDRFQDDPKLREAAEARLKAINSAYVLLTAKGGQRASRQSAHSATRTRSKPQAASGRSASFFAHLIPSPVMLLKCAALGCGLVIFVLLAQSADSYFASQPTTGRIYSELREGIVSNFREATGDIWNRTVTHLHGFIAQKVEAIPAAAAQSADAEQPAAAAPLDPADPVQNLHRRELGAAHAETVRLTPYITTGLTQEEVKAVQGAPTSASEDKLIYGGSELDFTHGKLTGWKLDSASAPIRVKLWPDAPVDPGLAAFHVGSSRSAVLVVQGTPTYLSKNEFGYGGSMVYFQDDRVISWKNDPATVPLRVEP